MSVLLKMPNKYRGKSLHPHIIIIVSLDEGWFMKGVLTPSVGRVVWYGDKAVVGRLALEDRAVGSVGRDVALDAVEEAADLLKPVALPVATEPSRMRRGSDSKAHDLALFIDEGGIIEEPGAASDGGASSSSLRLRYLLCSGKWRSRRPCHPASFLTRGGFNVIAANAVAPRSGTGLRLGQVGVAQKRVDALFPEAGRAGAAPSSLLRLARV